MWVYRQETKFVQVKRQEKDWLLELEQLQEAKVIEVELVELVKWDEVLEVKMRELLR